MNMMKKLIPILLLLLMLGCTTTVETPKETSKKNEPKQAPDFTLTNQEGELVKFTDYSGKVVVVSFMFTSCTTVCPLLTGNLVNIQEELGDKMGEQVQLLSISFDPERDKPQMLKQYSQAYDANLDGWSFLVGKDEEETKELMDAYGMWYKPTPDGQFDHTALTLLIDQNGMIRKEYWGYRYENYIDTILGEIDSLIAEESGVTP